MNNDSLSGKTVERLTLSGSPRESQSSEENRFLSTLAETLAGFDPKQAGRSSPTGAAGGGCASVRTPTKPGASWPRSAR